MDKSTLFFGRGKENTLYLMRDNRGAIMLCDKEGNIISGQSSVTVTNAVDEGTTATVTLYVGGWVEDGEVIP